MAELHCSSRMPNLKRRSTPTTRLAKAETPARAIAAVTRDPNRAIDAAWPLLGGILAVSLARLAFSVSSTTWGWGFDAPGHIDPLWSGFLGVVLLLALIPPLARRAMPACERIGAHPLFWAGAVLAAIGLAPDRLHFLGDWLMRRGAVMQREDLATLFPQALPLDLFLHVSLPRRLVDWTGIDSETVARLLGAVEALALALIGAGFARVLELPRSASFAAAATIAFGGALALFTGYNKAASEMVVIVAAAGLFATMAVRTGRGLLPLAIVTAIGLSLHRLGLALLPVFVGTAVLWLRLHGGHGAWRRPIALAALALPWIALAVIGPKVASLVLGFDATHHLPGAAGGSWWSVLSGARLLDRVNAIAVLAPLALATLALPLALRSSLRRPEMLVLLALALPLAAIALIVQPQQGVFRDLDVFAPAAVAASLLAALLVGWFLERNERVAWLAVPAAALAITSTIGWLTLNHDVTRGGAWVRGFVDEAPRRSPTERALTWDYLGYRAMEEDRWMDAAIAWSHAAEMAPSPRILTLWGMAETMSGDLPRARDLYRRSLSLDSGQRMALRGLASTSFRLGDYDEARVAVRRLQQMNIHAPELPDLVRELELVESREREAPAQATGTGIEH